ncbi:hypothetical protein PIB30_004975 [Stylosanthes scabra]|uniref:DUF4283 domain-containing protein n=1 Tax=Stylosanthes scabra TaxID=79078 RepID=A0ABU6X181_9FABA|nr:hypothetical protein [Stylosanthes scabra]
MRIFSKPFLQSDCERGTLGALQGCYCNQSAWQTLLIHGLDAQASEYLEDQRRLSSWGCMLALDISWLSLINLSIGKKVLLEGPWTISGHYLAVKPWTSSFQSCESSFGSILECAKATSPVDSPVESGKEARNDQVAPAVTEPPKESANGQSLNFEFGKINGEIPQNPQTMKNKEENLHEMETLSKDHAEDASWTVVHNKGKKVVGQSVNGKKKIPLKKPIMSKQRSSLLIGSNKKKEDLGHKGGSAHASSSVGAQEGFRTAEPSKPSISAVKTTRTPANHHKRRRLASLQSSPVDTTPPGGEQKKNPIQSHASSISASVNISSAAACSGEVPPSLMPLNPVLVPMSSAPVKNVNGPSCIGTESAVNPANAALPQNS